MAFLDEIDRMGIDVNRWTWISITVSYCHVDGFPYHIWTFCCGLQFHEATPLVSHWPIAASMAHFQKISGFLGATQSTGMDCLAVIMTHHMLDNLDQSEF